MLVSTAILGDVPPPFAVSYDLLALMVGVALAALGWFLVQRKRKR